MGVDLRGAYAGVAECELHGAQVGDSKQAGCEGVAQHVGGKGESAGGVADGGDGPLDRADAEGSAVGFGGQCVVGRGESGGFRSVDPGGDDLHREFVGNGYGAGAAALGDRAVELEGFLGFILPDQIRPGELAGFADAESGLQHEVPGEGDGVATGGGEGVVIGESVGGDDSGGHLQLPGVLAVPALADGDQDVFVAVVKHDGFIDASAAAWAGEVLADGSLG